MKNEWRCMGYEFSWLPKSRCNPTKLYKCRGVLRSTFPKIFFIDKNNNNKPSSHRHCQSSQPLHLSFVSLNSKWKKEYTKASLFFFSFLFGLPLSVPRGWSEESRIPVSYWIREMCVWRRRLGESFGVCLSHWWSWFFDARGFLSSFYSLSLFSLPLFSSLKCLKISLIQVFFFFF